MVDFVKTLLKIAFKILYRVKITGMSNIPLQGPVIICSNHIGQLDMFFMGYKIKRIVHFMAKEELFKIPFVGWFLKNVGAFPVNRQKADVGSIKEAIRILKRGDIIGIYPEGTRTGSQNVNQIKAKPGAIMLALKTGAPILPCAISGNYGLFGKVNVVFGKPTYYKEVEKMSNEEMISKARDVMRTIYSMIE